MSLKTRVNTDQPNTGHRYQRRLSDKLLNLFDLACDTDQLLVAHDLLLIIDNLLKRPTVLLKERRRVVESTVAAHERLWRLRHPETSAMTSRESKDQSDV
jgi:hypothetical protein